MKKIILIILSFFSLGVSGSFAWDINNYTFTEQHNIGTLNCDPIQLSYSHDGNFWSFLNYALRTGGCSGNTSYGKNLSTPWYINQISSSQNTYAGYSFSRVFDWFDNGDYYVRGRYYSGPGLQVHSCTTPYNSSTCTQIYSVAFTTTHLRGNIQNYYDASIYDNGNRLYIYVNGWIDEYSLSTPYDVSTLSLVRSYNIGGITGFKLTTDGSALFYNIGDTLYVYEISTSFDLTSTLSSLGNRVLLTGGNAFDIDDDGSHIIYSYKGDLTQADYVRGYENSDGGLSSPASAITNSGTRIEYSDGFGLNSFEVANTGALDFIVVNEDTSQAVSGDFSTTFGTGLINTPINFSYTGSTYFSPLTNYSAYWTYIDSNLDTFYGDTFYFSTDDFYLTNSGTITGFSNGFELNNFEVTHTGTLSIDIHSSTQDNNYKTIFYTGMLNTPTDLTYFGESNYILPNTYYTGSYTYTTDGYLFESDVFDFTTGNYYVTNTGTLAFNGAGFDITGTQFSTTGSILWEIKDLLDNIVYTGSVQVLFADVPVDFSFTDEAGIYLNPDTTYNVSWDFNKDGDLYIVGDDSFITYESLYYEDDGGGCLEGQDLYVNPDGPDYCIINTEQDVGDLIGILIGNNSETPITYTGGISGLYGTGVINFGFTLGSVAVNTGGDDSTCKPIFDTEGNFNYTKSGTPSEFITQLSLGEAYNMGDRWELNMFGVNIIGWIYDINNWIVTKAQEVLGNIMTAGFGIFDEYFSALRIPERNQDYCFLGINMYLKSNITEYYSYHQGDTIQVTGKNNIELIVLVFIVFFILTYIFKKL